MKIPDLRPDMDDITLEHCSVILEKLRDTLIALYPDDQEEWGQICDHMDVRNLREDLLGTFSVPAFMRLFRSQFGKGVITGAIMLRMFKEINEIEED